MLFLSIVVLWGQIENDVIRAIDAPCYALVAKGLTEKPLRDWVVLNWGNELYFANPHMTPWLLAVWMKIFGVSTLSALLPIVIISTLTVVLTYLIGRKLLDHSFGLLAGFVLTLTPSFIKEGRVPQLEPALMFFIMLSLFFHLRFFKKEGGLNTIWSGLAFAAAFLSKGPPSILAPLACIAFYFSTVLFAPHFTAFKVSAKKFWAHWFASFSIGIIVLVLVDAWSIARTGKSFFLQYWNFQMKYSLIESRGATVNDWFYYKNNLLHYYPWIYFMWLSLPVVAWLTYKKRTEILPAFLFGWLVTLGVFGGFTLILNKCFWYIYIHFASSSLIAAVPIWVLFAKKEKFIPYFTRFCMVIAIVVLFFSATFPSLFMYPRPLEQLLEKASKEYKNAWVGQKISNCSDLHYWRGNYLFQFHFGAIYSPCEDLNPIALINIRTTTLTPNMKVLIVNDPYAFISR